MLFILVAGVCADFNSQCEQYTDFCVMFVDTKCTLCFMLVGVSQTLCFMFVDTEHPMCFMFAVTLAGMKA